MASMSIELLQEIGLNKYEAEAYYALLTQGPLTGYELGKRSQVPLSRSYDVLERLSQKGLALVQPGEPARYRALEPALFLSQVRSSMEHTLNALADDLVKAPAIENTGDFWVVRGRRHILARAHALCAAATQTIQATLPATEGEEIAASLAQARERGCSVSLAAENTTDMLSLLIDGREALLGALTPAESCQAVLSTHPALLTLLASSFSHMHLRTVTQPDEQSSSEMAKNDWLEWEQRKQQRLQKKQSDRNIA